jgi:hypothetical protein
MGGYANLSIGGSCFPQVIHTCAYLVDKYYIILHHYIQFLTGNYTSFFLRN